MKLPAGSKCPICQKVVPLWRYSFTLPGWAINCPSCGAPLRFDVNNHLKFMLPMAVLIVGLIALGFQLHQIWIAFAAMGFWVVGNIIVVWFYSQFISDWS